jgi:putative transcriptional regulator
MDKKLFDKLTESMKQVGEIVGSEHALLREFQVDSVKLKEVRANIKLYQARLFKERS